MSTINAAHPYPNMHTLQTTSTNIPGILATNTTVQYATLTAVLREGNHVEKFSTKLAFVVI